MRSACSLATDRPAPVPGRWIVPAATLAGVVAVVGGGPSFGAAGPALVVVAVWCVFELTVARRVGWEPRDDAALEASLGEPDARFVPDVEEDELPRRHLAWSIAAAFACVLIGGLTSLVLAGDASGAAVGGFMASWALAGRVVQAGSERWEVSQAEVWLWEDHVALVRPASVAVATLDRVAALTYAHSADPRRSRVTLDLADGRRWPLRDAGHLHQLLAALDRRLMPRLCACARRRLPEGVAFAAGHGLVWLRDGVLSWGRPGGRVSIELARVERMRISNGAPVWEPTLILAARGVEIGVAAEAPNARVLFALLREAGLAVPPYPPEALAAPVGPVADDAGRG